jgi:hypothetical protein
MNKSLLSRQIGLGTRQSTTTTQLPSCPKPDCGHCLGDCMIAYGISPGNKSSVRTKGWSSTSGVMVAATARRNTKAGPQLRMVLSRLNVSHARRKALAPGCKKNRLSTGFKERSMTRADILTTWGGRPDVAHCFSPFSSRGAAV